MQQHISVIFKPSQVQQEVIKRSRCDQHSNSARSVASLRTHWAPSLCIAAPRGCVLEHAQPGRGCEGGPEVPGGPGPLPSQGAALWVRHHGQVPPVLGTEPSDALRGAVGVERVLLGGLTLVVKVPERGQPAGDDPLLRLGAAELHQPCEGTRLQERSILNAAAAYGTRWPVTYEPAQPVTVVQLQTLHTHNLFLGGLLWITAASLLSPVCVCVCLFCNLNNSVQYVKDCDIM